MVKDEIEIYVNRFKDGEEKAFDDVYNATNNNLYKVLFSYTKNEQLSLDLMQETYIVFYDKAYTIEQPKYVQNWLNRVAINKANRYLKTKNRDIILNEENEKIFENLEDTDIEFLPQEILDSKEKQKMIADIIDNLPNEQKAAVFMYYFNEMSLSEIAVQMDCSEGTIKSRLNYARKKIKNEVNVLEKKGTKLYSSAVPVIAIILKDIIKEAKAMDLYKSEEVLKNIHTALNAHISTAACADTVSKNALKKYILSTACVVLIGGTLFGGIYSLKNKEKHKIANNINTNVKKDKSDIKADKKTSQPENENKSSNEQSWTWITYDELSIDSVDTVVIADKKIVRVEDVKNERTIRIYAMDYGTTTITINGKVIDVTVNTNNSIDTGYEVPMDSQQ